MADLSLQLPVFIASPSDVMAERKVVEDTIQRFAARAASQRLLLQAVRWETAATPGWGRPQELTDRLVRRAELVVAIFWSTVGSPASSTGAETGTQEEVRIAEELLRRGAMDDLFLYFRVSPPEEAAKAEGYAQVQALRDRVRRAKELLPWDYESPAALERLFAEHLASWLDRWNGVPEICQQTLQTAPTASVPVEELGENRTWALLRGLDVSVDRLPSALARQAVHTYQRYGPRGYFEPLEVTPTERDSLAAFIQEDPGPSSSASWNVAARIAEPPLGRLPLLRDDAGRIRFVHVEWFAFFCALGLIDAIAAGDVTMVSSREYMNPVHQHVGALLRSHVSEKTRQAVCEHLRTWLRGGGGAGGRPIARNFAAYVAGMAGIVEAQGELADAAEHDRGANVRVYAVSALGKLRSRRHLALLTRLHSLEPSSNVRSLIGQAICRITGVAHYEL